jgi:hypothetical protein
MDWAGWFLERGVGNAAEAESMYKPRATRSGLDSPDGCADTFDLAFLDASANL